MTLGSSASLSRGDGYKSGQGTMTPNLHVTGGYAQKSTRSGGGCVLSFAGLLPFIEQLFDHLFHVLRLKADAADDAFAVNDGIRGIVMHSPCFFRFELWVAGGRILDSLVFGNLRHFLLATTAGANA